jgi:hypothetical protein
MNIFVSKTTVCADPNRHTRFIPETEPSKPFFTGFIGSTGAFSARSRGIFWENRAIEKVGVHFLFRL